MILVPFVFVKSRFHFKIVYFDDAFKEACQQLNLSRKVVLAKKSKLLLTTDLHTEFSFMQKDLLRRCGKTIVPELSLVGRLDRIARMR